MERKFTLSCCSTVDLPYSYMESRDIPVLFYTYVVDGQTYDDDMGRDPAALPRFYGFLKAGKLPQTSQINVAGYMDFFEKLLQQGGAGQVAADIDRKGFQRFVERILRRIEDRSDASSVEVADHQGFEQVVQLFGGEIHRAAVVGLHRAFMFEKTDAGGVENQFFDREFRSGGCCRPEEQSGQCDAGKE